VELISIYDYRTLNERKTQPVFRFSPLATDLAPRTDVLAPLPASNTAAWPTGWPVWRTGHAPPSNRAEHRPPATGETLLTLVCLEQGGWKWIRVPGSCSSRPSPTWWWSGVSSPPWGPLSPTT